MIIAFHEEIKIWIVWCPVCKKYWKEKYAVRCGICPRSIMDRSQGQLPAHKPGDCCHYGYDEIRASAIKKIETILSKNTIANDRCVDRYVPTSISGGEIKGVGGKKTKCIKNPNP
jgi:hypothetical protein